MMTLRERKTPYGIIVNLPADHTARSVNAAAVAVFATMPAHMRRTLTWDQGVEMTPARAKDSATELNAPASDPRPVARSRCFRSERFGGPTSAAMSAAVDNPPASRNLDDVKECRGVVQHDALSVAGEHPLSRHRFETCNPTVLEEPNGSLSWRR